MAPRRTVVVADPALAVGRDLDPVETELKLSATGPAPLRRLAEVETLGGTPLGAPETYLELDRYLDTDDGRLAAAKWACRLRSRSRAYRVSLKGPAIAAHELGGALHRRPEIEGVASARPDPSAWPPSAARDRLVELAGDRPLREQLTLRQRRTQRAVGSDHDRVGTLSLDRVLVVRDGEPMGRLWCVELELAGSTVAAADRNAGVLVPRLLAELLSVGELAIEPLTKLERALALVGRARS
jgi:inorganic triphosphatase YgiF